MTPHSGTLSTVSQSAPDESLNHIEPLARRRWRHYAWGLLPLAIVPFFVGGYYLRSVATNGTVPAVTEALSVEVIPVTPVSQYTTEREYTGELVAGRKSVLGFERTGTIVSILVDEGDQVVSGQPLARLDIRMLEAQRLQLEAQRQEAMAQLRELETGPRQEDITTAQ
ncbi:MAG: biotin/lipoyl-binding protein, partial [Cyanobacteria bacterium P01_H01_bin.121]